MSEQFTMEDQISYLEAYSNMLKAHQEMIDVQVKLLKSGKDMRDYFSKCNPFLNMYNINPFDPQNFNLFNPKK